MSGMSYTCPMHPEVKQEAPGRCPLCGMALVSETEESHEVKTDESYLPLGVIVGMILAVSWVTSFDKGGPAFIATFMAGFFLVFGNVPQGSAHNGNVDGRFRNGGLSAFADLVVE